MGALSLVLLSFALRYVLHPLIEPYAVFHFFILACLAVQYFFGYRFAILSVIVSIFLGEYYFVKPYGEFNELSSKDYIISSNFALVTLTAVVFMESLQRSLYARDLLLKVLNSRHKISLLRENDRIFYAQQSNQTLALLQELLEDFDQILLIRLRGFECKVEPMFIKLTQNPAILQAKDGWLQAIHEEDKMLLDQAWSALPDRNASNSPFDLRLIQANGDIRSCRVLVEHISFAGRALAILKLADQAESHQ